MTSAHLKCTLCEHSFVGFVDSSLNTPAYGGTKVPGRLVANFRRERDAEHAMHKRLSSIAHGETQVHVCVFCSQFFAFRKHETNFHNEMIEHFTIHEKMQDVDVKKLDDIFVAKERHKYFQANVEKKNLMVSIDRMLRWNAIEKNPDTYCDKLAEEDKRENADDEVQEVKEEEMLALELKQLKFRRKIAEQNNKIMLAKNRILDIKAKRDSGVSVVNVKRTQALTAPHKPTTNKRATRPASARFNRHLKQTSPRLSRSHQISPKTTKHCTR